MAFRVLVSEVLASPHDSTLHKSVQRYCFILYITTEIIKKVKKRSRFNSAKINELPTCASAVCFWQLTKRADTSVSPYKSINIYCTVLGSVAKRCG